MSDPIDAAIRKRSGPPNRRGSIKVGVEPRHYHGDRPVALVTHADAPGGILEKPLRQDGVTVYRLAGYECPECNERFDVTVDVRFEDIQ